jgi:hypothetical protein
MEKEPDLHAVTARKVQDSMETRANSQNQIMSTYVAIIKVEDHYRRTI